MDLEFTETSGHVRTACAPAERERPTLGNNNLIAGFLDQWKVWRCHGPHGWVWEYESIWVDGLCNFTSSIAHWKLQGKKGVWVEAAVKVYIIHLQPNLLKMIWLQQGFWFHHAEPNYVMLVCIGFPPTGNWCITAFLINQNREVEVWNCNH